MLEKLSVKRKEETTKKIHDNILGISRQIMALKPLIKDIITKNAEPTPNILNL